MIRVVRLSFARKSRNTNHEQGPIMTLGMFDIHPVILDGTITSSLTLDLLHGVDSLSNNNNNLFNELRTLDEAEVVIADFDVSGTTHEAHVWEVLANRSLVKWSRGTGSSVSGARSEMDADVFVVAVPPGVAVPNEPASEAGPPAPGTTQKKVRIKVAKEGGMPFR